MNNTMQQHYAVKNIAHSCIVTREVGVNTVFFLDVRTCETVNYYY